MGEEGGFGEGQKKVNLGRKWVETEDEGKSSCEKLRPVLAVLLASKYPFRNSDLRFGPW